MNIPFTKMVGTGNDFILLDTRREALKTSHPNWTLAARAFCDRHTGIGADGILVLGPSRSADVRMRIFNADGSEPEMCGNGARCVALYESGQRGRRRVTIQAQAGRLSANVQGDQVAIHLTDPTALQLDRTVTVGERRIRLGVVNTGVPHAVVPVSSVERVDVDGLGRTLRRHRAFGPRGTNVNFIQSRGRRLRIRTYERGVEAETLACGTGMTAAAIVHGVQRARGSKGRVRVQVEPKSGDRLSVSFAVSGRNGHQRVTDVVLTGPARRVFDGAVTWPRQGRR